MRVVGLLCFVDSVICLYYYPQLVEFHVLVHVSGLAIYSWDLLHGDQNGVTSIPAEIVGEVAHVCQEFCAAESVVLDYCRYGVFTVKCFTEVRMAKMAARTTGSNNTTWSGMVWMHLVGLMMQR